MTTQHTPGPWTFYRESSCDRGDSYGVKAPAPHYWVVPTLNINPEDARLIAAAPDLLEALQSLIDMDVAYQRGPKVEEGVQVARAAIAKATGQA
jgi:hypothetical protein